MTRTRTDRIHYLFAGSDYYPRGGMLDYYCSGTLEHCREVATKLDRNQHGEQIKWWHISVDNTIVEEG